MLRWANEYKLSCFEPQRELQVLVDIWWSVDGNKIQEHLGTIPL